jgi:hypothetical protein
MAVHLETTTVNTQVANNNARSSKYYTNALRKIYRVHLLPEIM